MSGNATRLIRLSGVAQTPNGTFEISLDDRFYFQQMDRYYIIDVGSYVLHLRLSALFDGNATVSREGGYPFAIQSGVDDPTSPFMELMPGTNMFFYDNSIDGRFVFSVYRQMEPVPFPWAEVCGSRARLIESSCPDANFSARVFPSQCGPACANSWFNDTSFLNDCIYNTPDQAGYGLFQTCEAQRPLQHFYPNYYGYNCSALEAQAAQQCAMSRPINATAFARVQSCAEQCARPWIDYASTCLLSLPLSHPLYSNVSRLTDQCQAALPLPSLAGLIPYFYFSTYSSESAVFFNLYPLDGAQTWTVEWSRSNATGSSWTVACMAAQSQWGSMASCESRSLPSFESVFVRVWAANNNSRSEYSFQFIPLTPGRRLPAPFGVSCFLNGTDLYASWLFDNFVWDGNSSVAAAAHESFGVMGYPVPLANYSGSAWPDMFRAYSPDQEPWTEPRVFGMLNTDQMTVRTAVPPTQRFFFGRGVAPADGSPMFIYVRAINRCNATTTVCDGSSRSDGHISYGAQCGQIGADVPAPSAPSSGTLTSLWLSVANGSWPLDSSAATPSSPLRLSMGVMVAGDMGYNVSTVDVSYYDRGAFAGGVLAPTPLRTYRAQVTIHSIASFEACSPSCYGPHVIYTRVVHELLLTLPFDPLPLPSGGNFSVSAMQLRPLIMPAANASAPDMFFDQYALRKAALANTDFMNNYWQLDVPVRTGRLPHCNARALGGGGCLRWARHFLPLRFSLLHRLSVCVSVCCVRVRLRTTT